MNPLLILVLSLTIQGIVDMEINEIQFRTMESCTIAAAQLERDLTEFNARAICVDRSAQP